MKIRLFSDMHLEFRKNRPELQIPELDTDKDTVLILAGDIGVGTSAVNPIIKIAPRFKHVLYIAGNHEYYDQNMTTLRHYLATKAFDYQDSNVTFLDNECCEIGGTWFYGGTMWTNMAENDPDVFFTRQRIKNGMNDFNCIKHTDANLTWRPEDAALEHDQFNMGLKFYTQAARAEDKKLFVITHHAPSVASVADKYKGQTLNAAYHAEQEEFLANNDDVVKWWAHGHMHHTVDYNIGETKVFSNPYGYHNYETNGFYDDKFTVEV